MMPDPLEPGWQCPKCERIWSPQVVACGMCALELQERKQDETRKAFKFYSPWNRL